MALSGCTSTAPLAPGCRPWEASADNTDPPSHCMFFPGSLAMDPLGDVLYATNTNADLSFGGSTLFAVDLLRFERAIACFRNPNQPDCGKVDCSTSGYALGSTATVEQTEAREAMLDVPPANFDRCYCQYDVDDPGIVNCEPQRFIVANQSVKLGFFPGDMKILAEDPPRWTLAPEDTVLHRGLYIAVRGDPSITFVDATRPLRFGRLPTGSSKANPDTLQLDLNCGQKRVDGHHYGAPYVLRQCADQNRVQRTVDDVLIDINNPDLGTQPRFALPAEPLGLSIDRGCIDPKAIHERGTFDKTQNPNPVCYALDSMGKKVDPQPPCKDAQGNYDPSNCYYQYLVSTHLPTGQVAAFNLPGPPNAGAPDPMKCSDPSSCPDPTHPLPPVLEDVSSPLFGGSDQRHGAFSVAPRVRGDLSQPWYVTSRLTGQIQTFRLATAAGPKIVPGLFLRLDNEFSVGAENISPDVRDVIFEPGSDRAFFASYTPPTLSVVDTRLRSNMSGVPNNQVTSVVNLCAGVSRIALARVPRQSMGVTTLASRVYATCYQSGQVAEVDVDSGELTGTIQIGRGPLDIALNFGATGGIDPCVDPYVSDQEAGKLNVMCPSAQPDLRPRPLPSVPQQIPPRAYVSTYTDSAIAVVDLDPGSPTYRRTLARIGLPSPKKVE